MKTTVKNTTRLLSLLIDWVVISIYLGLLLIIATLIYLTLFKGIPMFSELQSQVIPLLTSYIPIVLLFAYFDFYHKGLGKRMTGIEVVFEKHQFKFSILRNIIKFLPWQIAHFGIIHGMYHQFSLVSMIFIFLSLFLVIVYLIMALFRKDKKHLADLLAKSQVQYRE